MTSQRWLSLPTAHSSLGTLAGAALVAAAVPASVCAATFSTADEVAHRTFKEVLAIEILTYREGHGAEVRLPAWRNQFVGKTAADPVKIGSDIANISGATLSCTHITDGVHRLVAWAAKHPVAPKAPA